MSDIADMCDAATPDGARFTGRNRCAPGPAAWAARLPDCRCGGRPAYAQHPPMAYGVACEVLRCGSCGNQVGPFASRQTLAAAWRLYGRLGGA